MNETLDVGLSEFERQQVEKIAGWKAEPPSYLAAMLEKVTHPLVKMAERFVPPEKIAEAIDNAYESSEIQSHRTKIAERAGVSDIHELRETDLRICSELADMVAWECAEKAMFWGAGVGGSNLVSTLISLNSLLTNCLKTIHSIGYCFGFGTDEDHERDYVLGILLISCASSLKEKQEAVVTLGHMEDMIFEEAFEDLLEDAIAEEIIHSAGLTTIPVLGMLTGAMHSAALMEHTAAVAKYCFMERWLRLRWKIDRIPADPHLARKLVTRMRSRVGNQVYWGAFGVSFLVFVPFAWVASFIPTRNVAVRGLIRGRQDGAADALRFMEKVTSVGQTSSFSKSLIDVAVV